MKNTIGSGKIEMAMNASNELPHPRPSALYIDGPARGSTAPISDRRTVLAAAADAADVVNASTR